MRDTSLNRSLSESHLGPKVHLLSGIVLHSRLQHPFRLHPLDILHVPLTHENGSCGGKEEGKRWGKGLLRVVRGSQIFVGNFQSWLRLSGVLIKTDANVGVLSNGPQVYEHPRTVHQNFVNSGVCSVFRHQSFAGHQKAWLLFTTSTWTVISQKSKKTTLYSTLWELSNSTLWFQSLITSAVSFTHFNLLLLGKTAQEGRWQTCSMCTISHMHYDSHVSQLQRGSY